MKMDHNMKYSIIIDDSLMLSFLYQEIISDKKDLFAFIIFLHTNVLF